MDQNLTDKKEALERLSNIKRCIMKLELERDQLNKEFPRVEQELERLQKEGCICHACLYSLWLDFVDGEFGNADSELYCDILTNKFIPKEVGAKPSEIILVEGDSTEDTSYSLYWTIPETHRLLVINIQPDKPRFVVGFKNVETGEEDFPFSTTDYSNLPVLINGMLRK